mmetsp:Transcript_30205/g.93775  ORF Transcript_30205/g.93775 Transcript_30205/m.93775 type:complete len:366 (-) Transcript_30205:396-1493(-)
MFEDAWTLLGETEADIGLPEPGELSSRTSLSSLPPPTLQEVLDWPGACTAPSWPRQARLRSVAWWRQVAQQALLALGRVGLPREVLARELRALLVPSERALEDPRLRLAACPFPGADVEEALWDQLSDAYHAHCFLYDFGDILGRISDQVLGLPRLTWWVRQGRASQVVNFLLSSQQEFLQRPSPRPPPRWPWAEACAWPLSPGAEGAGGPGSEGSEREEGEREAVEALYDCWFTARAPAAVAAHRLLSGELCLEALSAGGGSRPEGGLPPLVHEEVMMTESGAEAGEATCRQEMEALRRSWLCFRSAEAERAEHRRSVLRERAAARLEREQRQRARRLQRATSLGKPGRPCARWAGQREWRRRQ